MKRGDIIFIVAISVALLACAAAGALTRQSYRNDVDIEGIPDKVSGYRIGLDDWLSDIYFDNDIQSLSQLKQKADVIVKVKTAGERKMLNQALLSREEILEIYKGGDLKKGQNIYIYEPTDLGHDEVHAWGGYIMQLDGQEYIFFLKKLKVPEGYRYKGREKISYMPVSTIFGKYSVKETDTRLVTEEELDKGIHFSEIRDMDIVTTNARTLETYREIKSGVIKMARGGRLKSPE